MTGSPIVNNWSGLHIEQFFVIEVAGGAVLASVSKQFGLGGLAVNKVRKQNSRSTICQLDLLQSTDRLTFCAGVRQGQGVCQA